MNTFFEWLELAEDTRSNELLQSSAKSKKFQDFKMIWEASACMEFPEAPDATLEMEKLQVLYSSKAETPVESKQRSMLNWSLVTAGALVVFLIAFASVHYFLPIRYGTALKEQRTLLLTDGSKVVLNSDSRLSHGRDFNETARDVFLSGEAYFDIRQGSIPFIVHTDIASIHAVGTQFNIKVRNNSCEVAVTEGRVEVAAVNQAPARTVTCSQGQYSICQKGRSPEEPKQIQYQDYPGWLQGKLIFHNTEFREVCAEIERHFGVCITVLDEQLQGEVISGLFEAEQASEVISSLCLLFHRDYRYEDQCFSIN